MSEIVVPEFLREEILHCKYLTHKKNYKTVLVLTQNLKLLEFSTSKKLLASLDLSETCLEQIKPLIEDYKRQKNCFNEKENTIKPAKLRPTNNSNIEFGKFVHNSFDILKFHIIVRCWNKLIVVLRQHDPIGFQLITEYDNVTSFKLTHGLIKYTAAVEIQFENEATIQTDFNENMEKFAEKSSEKSNQNDFQQIVSDFRIEKTNLHLQKAKTHRDFEHLRNTQTFGCNFVRSHKLEEKQMLSRCGDVWYRFSSDNRLVIGVPLVNNCESLKILRNVEPFFKINEEKAKGIDFDFHLYQLKQTFHDLETVETFFQSEDVELQADNWQKSDHHNILPEAYAVLIIKMKVIQVIHLGNCPLFLLFEIERDIPFAPNEPARSYCFQQQTFLKNLDFESVLNNRQKYEVCFAPKTLQQDFLTIAATSLETKLSINFVSATDANTFKSLLMVKFDFDKLERYNKISNDFNNFAMDIDEPQISNSHGFQQILFFNKKPNSLWYNLLVLEMNEDFVDEGFCMNWKFYSKDEKQLYLLLKLLFNELVLHKCNVKAIKFIRDKRFQNCDGKVKTFENALRLELSALSELINKKEYKMNIQKLFENLLELQLQTDIIAANV